MLLKKISLFSIVLLLEIICNTSNFFIINNFQLYLQLLTIFN